MKEARAGVLLIGYGNPGRMDDGLGPALAEAVEGLALPGVVADADYQLAVEHAEAIAGCDAVIFADAALSGPEPFSFRRIEPAVRRAMSFTSHSLQPEAVLALARDLFGADAEGHLLAVRGYVFNRFGETLSAGARENLNAAVRFLGQCLPARDFTEHNADSQEPTPLEPAHARGE